MNIGDGDITFKDGFAKFRKPRLMSSGHILWGYTLQVMPSPDGLRLDVDYQPAYWGFSMACVKRDDERITWDAEAMEKARP